MPTHLLLGLLTLIVACATTYADANVRVVAKKTGGVEIYRPGLDTPIFAFNAPADGRPYVHPILAPDGKGVLTEFSPGHHRHQTGIYVGFLKVNGRDYFHNRAGDYFRRTGFKLHDKAEGTQFTSVYELLDAKKNPQLTETQTWTFRDYTQSYSIDFDLVLKAHTDVTFDKHDYGGLFIRTPFKNQPGAKAINSEGQSNGKAEGQKARWVDIGMTVEGRKDSAHIAVLSHEPVIWRVDGQLGVGPARSRSGAWKLAKDESAVFRYRFLVYTGEFQQNQIEAEWKAFAEKK